MSIGKNTLRALKSAKNTDELIEKFAQPDTRKYRRSNNDKFVNTLRSGKIYYSEYYGAYTPTILRISNETLSKLKPCK